MSKYVDYTLRAPTEADAMAPAIEAVEHGFDLVRQDENGDWQWSLASARHAFDPIGSVITTPGTYDELGAEITAPVFDDRFHANLRVREDVADQVYTLLTTLGAPHSVEIGVQTGRVFA